MSKIAKLCHVSVVAALKWIKGAALQVEPLTGTSSSDVVMIDEMWHFVNGKKTKCGSVAPLTVSRDEWPGFFRLFPEDRHFYAHCLKKNLTIIEVLPHIKSYF